MGALVAFIFEQLDRVVPERARTRILACLSFLGLIAMIYVNSHTFAKKTEIEQLRTDAKAQVDSAVQSLTTTEVADRAEADRRWKSQLTTQVIQAAAKCKETHSDEARRLYAINLSKLLDDYESAFGKPYPLDVSRSCE
jgi:hypothetical protein